MCCSSARSRLNSWACRPNGSKQLMLLAASLTTAAAVAFAGIIGFIGLIVPHMVRLLWGAIIAG